MKVHASATSTIGTDLLGCKTKKTPRSKRQKRQDTHTASWNNRTKILERQSMIMRGVQTAHRWSETRADRIEDLRVQVAAGTYKVDSLTLAQSIMKNEMHFLDES